MKTMYEGKAKVGKQRMVGLVRIDKDRTGREINVYRIKTVSVPLCKPSE